MRARSLTEQTQHPVIWCAVSCLVSSIALTATGASPPRWLLLPLAAAGLLAALAHPAPRGARWRTLVGGFFLAVIALALPLRPTTLPITTAQKHEITSLLVTSSPERLVDAWRFEASTPGEQNLRVRCPYKVCSKAPLPGDTLDVEISVLPWDPPSHPAQLDHRELMLERGVAGRAYVKDLRHTRAPRGMAYAIRRALASSRLDLERRLLKSLPQDRAAWIMAMTLGSRGLLHPAQRAPFNLTGTSHLLAISGLHLGALAAILWWCIARLSLRLAPRRVARHGTRTLCALPVSALMTAYVVMIGAPLSARRALMMLVGALGAHLLMRRLSNIDALGFALLAALMWRPWVSREPALLLSACATLGILLSVRKRPQSSEDEQTGWRRALADLCRVSLAAWLATSPVVLWLGGELPLLGATLNLVFVPLVSFLLFPLMVLGMALLWLSPVLGTPLLNLAASMMEGMHMLAAYVSCLPGAVIRPGAPTVWWILPYGIAVAGLFVCGWVLAQATDRGKKRDLSIKRAVAILAMIMAALAPGLYTRHMREGALTLDFISVGQGDATLITFPDGRTMLIDAGGAMNTAYDPGMRAVLPHLRWRGVHTLDVAMLTHADVDHMRGFFTIAALATPDVFLTDPRQVDVEEHRALLEEMEVRGSTVHLVDTSYTLEFEGETGSSREGQLARVHVIKPEPENTPERERNDLSLTLMIEYAGVVILLPGDLEGGGERWLLEQPSLAASLEAVTIQKMGHHGSKTSSSQELLDVTKPSIAIASSGRRNMFGHPAKEIVERYERGGASVWRTDRDGLVSVKVSANGEIEVFASRDL